MIDTALQILLILAYLAIGLIAVTFPIYAICVTYLKTEKSETEKERKKRLKVVQSKLSDLTAKLQEGGDSDKLKQIRAEIKKI